MRVDVSFPGVVCSCVLYRILSLQRRGWVMGVGRGQPTAVRKERPPFIESVSPQRTPDLALCFGAPLSRNGRDVAEGDRGGECELANAIHYSLRERWQYGPFASSLFFSLLFSFFPAATTAQMLRSRED